MKKFMFRNQKISKLLLIKDYFMLDQRLLTNSIPKIKKNFQYLLLLKNFNFFINYKNIKLLKYFLTKYGKICSRKNTNVNIKIQKKISKAIKQSRTKGLLVTSSFLVS
jgi:ribosomal protein S18